jgi:hypothetical protein
MVIPLRRVKQPLRGVVEGNLGHRIPLTLCGEQRSGSVAVVMAGIAVIFPLPLRNFHSQIIDRPLFRRRGCHQKERCGGDHLFSISCRVRPVSTMPGHLPALSGPSRARMEAEATAMKKLILAILLSIGLLFASAPSGFAAVRRTPTRYYSRARARRIRHRRNVTTAKRVGITAAGGAAIGALAGGGKGAGIGAIAGAGAGYLYDKHERNRHK